MLGRRERPSLLAGFRAATFLCQGWMWLQLDVAETGAGCAAPVSSRKSTQIQEFLPEKGTLSFTTTNLPLIQAH